MRKVLLVAAAVAPTLFMGDAAIAYWNGHFMAPPPVPQPPGGFGMSPTPGWDLRQRTSPVTADRGAGAYGRAAPAQSPPAAKAVTSAAEAQDSVPVARMQALQTLQAEYERLRAECAAEKLRAAAASAPPEAGAVERLSAELAQVRSELMASTRRIHDLMAERDELRAQFGSNMGDVASVRNAFEQVRKRAVEVGNALSESQGTDVGGGLEQEFLRADLDRLIAALALADAVLSDADPRTRAGSGPGSTLRAGDWQRGARDADLIEAASFESDP